MERITKTLVLIFISYLMLQGWVSVNGQNISTKYIVDSEDGAACEINAQHIDELVAKAKNNKEKIFVISRLSKGEKSRVSKARLMNAYTVLTTVREVPSEQIIIATGEMTNETKGRLEFYIGSQFFLVSLAEKNKQVCLTCCDSPF